MFNILPGTLEFLGVNLIYLHISTKYHIKISTSTKTLKLITSNMLLCADLLKITG